MKYFNKNDFKNGMVIELNNSERRLFWEGRFIDKRGYIPLSYFNDELINQDSISGEFIYNIFLTHDVGYLEDFFDDDNLTRIWSIEGDSIWQQQ